MIQNGDQRDSHLQTPSPTRNHPFWEFQNALILDTRKRTIFDSQKPYFFILDHKNHLSTLGLIFLRLENAGPQSRFKKEQILLLFSLRKIYQITKWDRPHFSIDSIGVWFLKSA